jgi:hypothetical protein
LGAAPSPPGGDDRQGGDLHEEQRQQGVNGEWSTVESFRHLVLVIDLWLSHDRRPAGSTMALRPSFMPPKLFPDSSIDPDARCETLDRRLTMRRRR